MPKRTDINTILVIGSGPIVIGQACEFDYSGAQACKVLKEEGYRVVLVNSNPASGENEFYGEFLMNAQGEDVVAGVRTPAPLLPFMK